MLRILWWFFIWVITLCAADIKVQYQDGLNIMFTGWISVLSRKLNKGRK